MNQNKTSGLTLLELVVALAISVLLVGATAGVLKSMAQKKEIFAGKITAQTWHLELSRRLRTDFLHATQLRVRPNGFSLTGPCGYDLQKREFQQKRAAIDWTIVRQGEQSVLLRRQQTDELVIASDLVSTEFFCVGIESILVGTFTGEESTSETPAAPTAIATGEWSPIAPAIRLIACGPDNTLLLDEVFYR